METFNIKNKFMMKKLLTIALGLVTTISFAQTFVSTTPENKKVVLEEFTGIYCGFCPDGHVLGQALHTAYPSARTEKIPNVDLNLEDYTMLYRMVENGTTPKVKIISTSKELGEMPTFNTIAQIKGWIYCFK